MEPTSPNLDTRPRKSSFWSNILEWLKVIIIALLISLPIRFFIAEPFIVNGASMDPTFKTGQFLVVDRLTYNFQEPQRGDVIVFKYPNNPKIYYIKRIIGLPNETLNIKDGLVSTTDNVTKKSIILKELYVDQNYRSFDNLDIKLGPNEYFVMGDNRLASSDSRVWGPLNTDFIVGRPIIRLFPITKFGIFPGNLKQYE